MDVRVFAIVLMVCIGLYVDDGFRKDTFEFIRGNSFTSMLALFSAYMIYKKIEKHNRLQKIAGVVGLRLRVENKEIGWVVVEVFCCSDDLFLLMLCLGGRRYGW